MRDILHVVGKLSMVIEKGATWACLIGVGDSPPEVLPSTLSYEGSAVFPRTGNLIGYSLASMSCCPLYLGDCAVINPQPTKPMA